MANMTGDVQKLNGLIKDIEFAMLTTECADGSLHSRPMATQKADFDGTLWFFTRDDSHKLSDISGTQKVNVSYASPKNHRYVSVFGKAEVVKDREKFRELWNPAYQAWFPEGIDDPHLCLLKVNVESAEYWDSPGSAEVQLVGFVKAKATGKPAQEWENKKLRLVS